MTSPKVPIREQAQTNVFSTQKPHFLPITMTAEKLNYKMHSSTATTRSRHRMAKSLLVGNDLPE